MPKDKKKVTKGNTRPKFSQYSQQESKKGRFSNHKSTVKYEMNLALGERSIDPSKSNNSTFLGFKRKHYGLRALNPAATDYEKAKTKITELQEIQTKTAKNLQQIVKNSKRRWLGLKQSKISEVNSQLKNARKRRAKAAEIILKINQARKAMGSHNSYQEKKLYPNPVLNKKTRKDLLANTENINKTLQNINKTLKILQNEKAAKIEAYDREKKDKFNKQRQSIGEDKYELYYPLESSPLTFNKLASNAAKRSSNINPGMFSSDRRGKLIKEAREISPLEAVSLVQKLKNGTKLSEYEEKQIQRLEAISSSYRARFTTSKQKTFPINNTAKEQAYKDLLLHAKPEQQEEITNIRNRIKDGTLTGSRLKERVNMLGLISEKAGFFGSNTKKKELYEALKRDLDYERQRAPIEAIQKQKAEKARQARQAQLSSEVVPLQSLSSAPQKSLGTILPREPIPRQSETSSQAAKSAPPTQSAPPKTSLDKKRQPIPAPAPLQITSAPELRRDNLTIVTEESLRAHRKFGFQKRSDQQLEELLNSPPPPPPLRKSSSLATATTEGTNNNKPPPPLPPRPRQPPGTKPYP